MLSDEEVRTIAADNADVHITEHGGEFGFFVLHHGVYLLSVKHPSTGLDYDEPLRLIGMPDEIAREYIHVKVHSLAAKLIGRLYPVSSVDPTIVEESLPKMALVASG